MFQTFKQIILVLGVRVIAIKFPRVITFNIVAVGDFSDPLLTCGMNHIAYF
ncbi:hypothetical protein VCHA47P369_50369 [Vibrio chagasii]|nr:hypothetical protein VCHA35O141_20101 [Vibrio chagasii]CAH6884230.1 hypothetical protein VCHA37O173_20551 [Vibrio chagasii]CAH6887726.1 hypothetical protein VCHA35O137_20119 [Vibrio chagasii]CAH6896201.1 hypothetical protein VCHA34O109_20081 [Vibrio chagasii]CAH6897316.1 hypothetical protein VCHA34P116_20406 [Vibrio chagasii]